MTNGCSVSGVSSLRKTALLSIPERHLWMAPALQALIEDLAFGRVQSSVRPVCAVCKGLLALMGFANKMPIRFAGCCAFAVPWLVLVPGLTNFAITSLCAHNFVRPISSTWSRFYAARVGTWWAW